MTVKSSNRYLHKTLEQGRPFAGYDGFGFRKENQKSSLQDGHGLFYGVD